MERRTIGKLRIASKMFAALIVGIVLSLICGISTKAYAAGVFRDVDSSTPHYDNIMWLYENGITTGFGGGSKRTFQPYSDVARCDMAAFLYRLAGSPDYTPSAAEKAYFSDVNASTPHAKEVWWLASTGISKGWTEQGGSHTFRPYDNVARCDMAAFLYRLAGRPSYDGNAYFSDVSSTTPHAKEVWWLSSMGVSTGWERNYERFFRPYSNVARCDMAAFLNRMDDNNLVADPESLFIPETGGYEDFAARYQAIESEAASDVRLRGSMNDMALAASDHADNLADLMNDLLDWTKELPGADVSWLDRSQEEWVAELKAEQQPIRDEFDAQPYSGNSYAINLVGVRIGMEQDRIEELLDYAAGLLGK